MTGNTHTHTVSTLAAAALIGAVLVAPLLFLELRNSPATFRTASDLAVLFGLLWVLPTAFVLTVTPVVRAAESGRFTLQRPAALAVRIAVLVLLAAMWLGIVNDQLPCFLGVPNCD